MVGAILESDYVYEYAAYFETGVGLVTDFSTLQNYRIYAAWLSGAMVIENIMSGNVDTFVNFANFTLWGQMLTTLSLIEIYKSSKYEIEKGDGTDEDFPYSIHYKKYALNILMMANAVNFIVLFTYLVYLLPA
jgi:hypothetical protein